MKSSRLSILSGLLLGTLAVPAFSADLPSSDRVLKGPEPVIAVNSFEPFQVRLRAIGVFPSATGSVTGAPFGVKASNSYAPEIDASYFFNPNFAVELNICCGIYSNVNLTNAGPFSARVAHTYALPPVLALQYHFTNFGAFQPYVGVGINYTHYFNTKTVTGTILGGTNLHISDSFGPVGQVGFDYMIDRNWGINADVKYVSINSKFRDSNGTTGKAKVNPWVVGLGLTYRFGGQ